MTPLAHLGHYLVWALYALPVLIVVVAIAYSTFSSRRRKPGGGRNTRP